MINAPFNQSDCTATDRENAALQQYVHALLARQQALDLLETIHQQINHVWSAIRRLLDGTGAAVRAAKAVRVARAAQAAQTQNTYRALEKRREECIAALHQAERRANAALQTILAANPQPASEENTDFPLPPRVRTNDRLACRPVRRKLKSAFSGHC
jgi:phage-related minor tail protein